MADASILNLGKRDPFADLDDGDAGITGTGGKEGYVRTYNNKCCSQYNL